MSRNPRNISSLGPTIVPPVLKPERFRVEVYCQIRCNPYVGFGFRDFGPGLSEFIKP